jgi:hypothetical protein
MMLKTDLANDPQPCAASPFIAVPFLLALIFGVLTLSSATAQTQDFPCETVIQIGSGTSTNGVKLRPGAVDPLFDGTDATFPNPPNTYVLTDPAAAWIANSASADSQWIGPSSSIGDDVAGTSVYRLQLVMPCAGARLTGRYAASDRGMIGLNGTLNHFPTPATGSATWTSFTFNNLLPGLNRLEFYVTNSVPAVGGPPGASGLRVELTATATCCPCIELTCPSDIFLTTCSNGAPANFTITGTNRCFTNLTINCSLASIPGVPITSGYVFPVGTNTVICTASDTAGHRTNCSFRVIVTRDTQAPQIRCPQDIIYPCSGSGKNVFFNVTATDDASPALVVNCVPPSGSFFPPGTNTVFCEARDLCGNIGRCSFRVVLVPDGFTKTLQAGVADDFQPNDLEPANPGPCLGASGYWTAMPFDTYFPGRHLAHSFPGLPDNLLAATLILRMKPRLTTSQDDMLRIGLQNCGSPGAWAFAQPIASLPGAGGTWVTNLPTTFTLDLAALPGGANLLAGLNANHRLEFAVGTETLVDYARLEMTYCGPQSTLSGVPYSLNNVQTTHGSDGVSWQRVNSNGPPATIQFDIGQADGFRFDFGHGVPLNCDAIENHLGQSVTWLPGDLNTATARFEVPGTNLLRVMVTLDQPTNHIGKIVEVWHDDHAVSRYFFPGSDPTGVTVPEEACVQSMGFTKSYFFVNFTSLQEIDLKAPEVPATQHFATFLGGDIGPVVMGTSVRLYFVKFYTSATKVVINQTYNHLNVSQMSLLQGEDWIEGFGPQQLTISDAIHSRPFLPGALYGDCVSATPGWTIEFQNPIADFCTWIAGAPFCLGGHVDVTLKSSGGGLNSGGLRLTPTALFLPSDSCRIDNTVANSTVHNVILWFTVGAPLSLNNVSSIESSRWPDKISGTGGPQSFVVDLPPNTAVTVNGQTLNVTRVTFNSTPPFLATYSWACVETIGGLGGLPIASMAVTPTNPPSPPCLTLSCPTNVIVVSRTGSNAVVTFNPTGTTRCGSNVVITCAPPSGSVFPPGATVVQCSAIDSLGNQEQCEFLVTVLPASPLSVTRLSDTRLELRWVGDAMVESADALGERPIWRRVIGTPTSSGVESILVVPIEPAPQFFRTVPLPLAP